MPSSETGLDATIPRRDAATAARALVIALFVPLLFAGTAPAAQRDGNTYRQSVLENYQHQHARLHDEFAKELGDLAAECEAAGFPDEAERIRRLSRPIDTRALRFEELPETVQPEIPLSLPREERLRKVQLRRARQEYAKDLYLLARRSLNDGYGSFAYDLVREVAHHDPDHRPARRLLGYVRSGEEWVTPFEAWMRKRDHVWHDRFGWLPENHVERYENGERFYKRWMSATQEAEIRRDFRHAWEVRTDHYVVKTNHSLERGVEIAVALENFYRYFFQTFAGFFNTRSQMQKLFDENLAGQRMPTISNPYEVHYYRTREEYNQRLQSKIPQIAVTNGLYYTSDRIAYFFHDEPVGSNNATLFHEASHQLFYESTSRDRRIADDAHFWIIEGIACYMESFRQQDGEFSLGDPRYIRFQNARDRLLTDNYGEPYYVPLAEMDRMGMRAFQSHPNMRANYSQASGLAHFFMHYNGGEYREALVTHLSQLYSPNSRVRRDPKSLPELTGASYAVLDAQYQKYLETMAENLQSRRRGSAGRSRVIHQ